MQKNFKVCCVLVALALQVGCSSHYMAINYEPTQEPVIASGTEGVHLVRVSDSRGTPENWLGAVRGGYGNPLKKLYTDEPTSKTVHRAFIAALKERKLFNASAESGARLDVDVIKFDTSYYFNKEAHAHLNIMLSDVNGKIIYEKEIRKDRERGGVGAGVFGDVDALAEFANETLNEAIDEALNDVRLQAALLSP